MVGKQGYCRQVLSTGNQRLTEEAHHWQVWETVQRLQHAVHRNRQVESQAFTYKKSKEYLSSK